MKTLPLLASIAAVVAFVVYQFTFPVSVSLLFAAGFLSIVIADYGRALASVPAHRVPVLARSHRLRLAA